MKNLLKFLFFLTIISGIVWACAKEKENTVPIEIASPVVENLTPNANGDIVVPIDDMIKEAGIRAGGLCQVFIKFECSKATFPGFNFALPYSTAGLIPSLKKGICYDPYDLTEPFTCHDCKTNAPIPCLYNPFPNNPCPVKISSPFEAPDCEFACQITATGNATAYDRLWSNSPSPGAIVAAKNAVPMLANLPVPACDAVVSTVTSLANLDPLTDASWNDTDVINLPISPTPNSIVIHNTASVGNLITPWITGSKLGSFVRWTFSIKGSNITKVYTMTVVKPNATNPYPGTSYKVQNCSF